MAKRKLPSPKTPGANVLDHRVYYGETDQMGRVYYGNYPAWFDQGRAELFRDYGMPYMELEQQGIHLPVRSCAVRYHHAAKYDDLLKIVTVISNLRHASITFLTAVYNQDDELLAEGTVELACVKADGSPQRFPSAMHEFLSVRVQEGML
ncbi:MAG: acyl-CoA thioesterase [Planctomycetes bacterium]|nr:acyl-CoA thioesterase [Planctomycetota bacterium]